MPIVTPPTSAWTRDNPYQARITANHRLTSQASDKDVHHVEIDLGDSGIVYQPGDTMGIWVRNHQALVTRILRLCNLQGSDEVTLDNSPITLFDALSSQFELTQVHPGFLKRFAEFNPAPALQALVNTPADFRAYLDRRQIADVMLQFPAPLSSAQLLACLRRMTPRQYSIASSPLIDARKVALTIAHVHFQVPDGNRQGAGSGYLCERVDAATPVPVFPVENPNFRLPDDPTATVIMIGPGTGIAPFRAFLQHREISKASGRNWLFFGNPHRSTDFLYAQELQGFVDRGVLNTLSLAFSRDQGEKRYVQHLMLEQASDLFAAMQDGAVVYVCGDAKRMAEDVQRALLQIIEQCGGLDPAAARQYLVQMRQNKRYQRDVY